MTYDELIAHYGSEPEAGRALGLPRQTVHRWRGRKVPTDQQLAYEVATGGVLRADIPDEVRSVRAAA